MTLLFFTLALAALIFASGVYSGSEIGLYSVSRARADVEAQTGSLRARLVRQLLEADSAVLITILVGNNLVLEAAAHVGDELTALLDVPLGAREVVLTLALTPVLFFFGELLPKDLFRRRPYALLGFTVWWIAASRAVFWPLERVLSFLSFLLEKVFRIEPRGLVRVRGREAVLTLLAEGTRTGSHGLVANALELKAIPVERAMIPWSKVRTVPAGSGPERVVAALAESPFSRVPVVEPGRGVTGYLHQLDVLSASRRGVDPTEARRMIAMERQLSVDRALSRLRATGHRCAVVGTLEEPIGLVTLKDLVEEISGDLGGW